MLSSLDPNLGNFVNMNSIYIYIYIYIFFSQIQPIQILYRSETHKIRKILTVDLKNEGLLSLQMNIVFRRLEVLHYISAPLSLLFTISQLNVLFLINKLVQKWYKFHEITKTLFFKIKLCYK